MIQSFSQEDKLKRFSVLDERKWETSLGVNNCGL